MSRYCSVRQLQILTLRRSATSPAHNMENMRAFVSPLSTTSFSRTVFSTRTAISSFKRPSSSFHLSRFHRSYLNHPVTAPVPKPTMRVATDGDSVDVHYTGYLDDGTEFDSSRKKNIPLNFVIGTGAVIRGFDDAVRGLRVGESRRTRIEPANAYGNRSDELIMNLPVSTIPPDMKLKPGDRVPLSNGMRALVTEINDENVRIDANHELAGKALTFDMELVGFQDPVLSPPAEGLKRAVFGLGCFWGAELAYQRVVGVVSTKVGYTHGKTENPTYQQVCSGSTGHAEGVAVDYDPSVVSFESLVDLFWKRLGRSALTRNQVGNDVGTQYRSGIYYLDDDQKKIAVDSCRAKSEELGKDVVVEVESAVDVPFYLAETYHQRYLEKGGQSAEKNATETIRCYG